MQLYYGPPGTGKTTRLIEILKQELADGVLPARIAYSSFTRKAVHEVVERVGRDFKLEKTNLKYFKTLHALAYAMLSMGDGDILQTKHYQELSEWLSVEIKGRRIMDSADWGGAGDGDKYLFIDQLARARRIPLRQLYEELGGDVDWYGLKYFVNGLNKYKDEYQMLDFTDLLEQALTHDPLPIDVAIIDEAQDLSNLQWDLVEHTFSNAQRVYIAGDDDQAIYEWSGANPLRMNKYADEAAQVTVLEQSWRIPSKVHKIANTIIGNVTERYEKQFLARADEGTVEWVTAPEFLDLSEGQWLLLARNRYMLKDYARVAKDQGIYFSISGSSSVRREHLGAIVAWTHLRRGHEVKVHDVRQAYELMELSLSPLKALHDDETIVMSQLKNDYGLCVQGTWYDLFKGVDAKEREYYAELIKSGEDLLKEPRVLIDTIHSVKGGEADNVALMLDMSYRTYQFYTHNPDPEHRVFYVGATRARASLYIIEPQTHQYYEDI